jgi:TolB-like protein/Tfp pilus assembly protein PilF
MIDRTLIHYRITASLGAGGMGEVYRATDTKLGRDVALKVLPAEMAGDPERLARFQREARVVAALNHPHIVTIFSVEEAEGIHFLTMELVEGQSLDRCIPAGGMPVEQIVEVAQALADALAAAHEKGIVHRDLKPANVMVSREGRVKVLDFGLAKDINARPTPDATMTSAGQTEIGVVMGTPAYMSPEQVSGRTLDARTDIFSLGVLLHEMATSQRPFGGTSSAELISAILRDTPASVTDLRPELPPDLARIIRRCLEKDTRHRLQTARDVANEFRDLARSASRPPSSRTGMQAVSTPGSGSARAAAREDEGFWIAVLPFKYSGSNADLAALAEGLSEEIITGLSRFSYLRVVARGSTARYAGQSVDVRTVGREIGARYVMEGTLRQAGNKLRLAVQLVDTLSGAHLWAETYERAFSSEAVFEIQDDLAPRIVSTVADRHGVLLHSMSETVLAKSPEQLTPYQAVLLSFGYAERLTADERATAKASLERSVAQVPGYADAWAMLAMVHCDEYTLGTKPEGSLLDRALETARRAVKAGPSNHLAYQNLAYAYFLRREFGPCRNAAERTLALNSLDGSNVWFMGLLTAYTGEWDRGCALVDQAMRLNPHYPGKYRYPLVANAYRKADYADALNEALKLNMPDLFYTPLWVAAAAAQLGDKELAEKALRDLLRLKPNFDEIARENLGKWFQAELVEHIIDGLRKAGLEIADEDSPPADVAHGAPSVGPSGPAKIASGAARTAAREDEGFWIAVLPFKYSGNNADLTALAEGLTEEIITGMSRFSHLRVIARGSTAKYSSEAGDLRAIGKELGARYVMEGSVRPAGTKVRMSAHLVDTSTGAGLWADTYDRAFSSDAMLDLLDDVVPCIVATVGDSQGVLAHSMTNALRDRDPESLTQYEAVLRSFGYHQHVSREEHLAGLTALEHAIQQTPVRADCWAMLSWLYRGEFSHGFNARPDPLGRASEAARRAIETDPTNAIAHAALASVLFCEKDFVAFRTAAKRALALNRMEGYATAYLGLQLAYSGAWEEGCALVERATHLNANHPGWYWLPLSTNAYRLGDGPRALEFAHKVNIPGLWTTHLALALSYCLLGELDKAKDATRRLVTLRPKFAEDPEADLAMWFQPELAQQMLTDLRKAGLNQIRAQSPAPSPPAMTSAVATGKTGSGATRADEGFWVAVLPFKYSGNNQDLKALAEGLSEEVVTGLSRFSYLRVISRGSTAKYSSESGDVRAIGKELGARYVMEGSLRQAGSKLRLAIQLVEAAAGSHLWAETFERPFQAEEIFALQDDLVPRIVSTVADAQGVLLHSMADSLRSKPLDQMTGYEAMLRAFAYTYRFSAEEHALCLACAGRAVELAPNLVGAWSILANLYADQYGHDFRPLPDSLDRALQAAQRAIEVDDSHSGAHAALAKVRFLRKEFPAFRSAADRAFELNPFAASQMAIMGILTAYTGEWERGCAMIEHAAKMNPRHPGWFWVGLFVHAYHKRDYREAVRIGLKFNMPDVDSVHLLMAAAYGQLGELAAAEKEVQHLLRFRPHAAREAREALSRWHLPETTEHLLEGLRKAGLEIPDQASSPAHKLVDPSSAAARADEGFWVAVLPFHYSGSNADLKALAEGLSEEIITGLSRFSYLRVIARGSTAKYSSESGDVRAICKELGARYVMEGSLRLAGSKLRLAVQLVEATTGSNLWAETFERTFSADNVFELQDELVPRIVATVADMNGVLPLSMSQLLRGRAPEQMSPYEAVLSSFGYCYSATPQALTAARTGLEHAVRNAPTFSDAWAMLSFLCGQDYVHGYELQANALEVAASAARRAVELGPSNHLAYFSLGQALWCQKDYASFRDALERAVALNSMDGNSIAYLGELLTYTGSAERGMQLVGRAKQLNPNHPGWYWFADFYHAFSQGDYPSALAFALKAKLRGNPLAPMFVAAACGQAGDLDAGAKAVAELVKFRPELPPLMRKQVAKVWNAEYGARFLEGLSKSGMDIPAAGSKPASGALPVRTPSGENVAGEGFWVAVLPFKYTGANQDLKALAEGLAEEVITGLSRFSYLRVIARGSTARYSGATGDVRIIGTELGARYVLEASLRQAGSKLRLAVQLVDTVSGSHLWAETYERNFTPESIFELQDDLVPCIVSTVADQHGVLPRSMSEVLRKKNEDSLTPHEASLRAFAYFTRLTPEEHAVIRRILESAVHKAPDHADCWAMLSLMYIVEYSDGYNALPDPLGRALAAADRAVDLAPTHSLGHYATAFVYFFRKEKAPFRAAVDRAVALNPMDGTLLGLLGLLLHHSGDEERGLRMAESGMRLNPNYPGILRFTAFSNAYLHGRYEQALEAAVRINMPGFFYAHACRAAALGQLGQREAAQKAVRDTLALRSDFGSTARHEFSKWWRPEQVEHLLDGLRKAGLEVADAPEPPRSGVAKAASGAVSLTPSIAVLPFANLSADPEQDYFSDGLAEEIINLLAQVAGLKVIARTSVFAFRGKEQDIRGIAETLGVNTVLEGSVRRSGSRVRVTAQLIAAADGSHLWSERYDRELSDIFAVQDEIAEAISKALRVKLAREAAPERYVPKLPAYEAYLRGKHSQSKVTPEALELARRCYEQALELDPDFALAHVGLGYYWVMLAHFGRHSVHDGVVQARAQARRALQIDPSLPDAHALLGYVAAMYDQDWATAEKHFDFPGAKHVGFETVRPLYGGYQFFRGNISEAIALAQQAIAEDPLEVWARMNLHAYLQAAGRYDEALEQLHKVLELDPHQVVAMASIAMIHADRGQMEEALKVARRAYAVGPWFPEAVGILAALLRRQGDEGWKTIAAELGSGEAHGDPRGHLMFHLLSGEIDEGADWVEKALEQRDPSAMFDLRFVACKGLRASHRWPKIAKMINLPDGRIDVRA